MQQSSFSGVKTIELFTTSTGDNFKLRSGEVRWFWREREFTGVQQTEGSSTAAAPSVAALTHLAIVWEARLIESEHREGANIFYICIFYLFIHH